RSTYSIAAAQSKAKAADRSVRSTRATPSRPRATRGGLPVARLRFRPRGVKARAPWCDQTSAHPSRKAREGWGTLCVVVPAEGWATRLYRLGFFGDVTLITSGIVLTGPVQIPTFL